MPVSFHRGLPATHDVPERLFDADKLAAIFHYPRDSGISAEQAFSIINLPLEAWVRYASQPRPENDVLFARAVTNLLTGSYPSLPDDLDAVVKIDRVRTECIQRVQSMSGWNMDATLARLSRRYRIIRRGRIPMIAAPPMLFSSGNGLFVPVGPFGLQFTEEGVMVFAINGTAKLEVNPSSIHPHVSGMGTDSVGGHLCLGTEAGSFGRSRRVRDYRGMIETAFAALSSYNPASPYCGLSGRRQAPVYHVLPQTDRRQRHSLTLHRTPQMGFHPNPTYFTVMRLTLAGNTYDLTLTVSEATTICGHLQNFVEYLGGLDRLSGNDIEVLFRIFSASSRNDLARKVAEFIQWSRDGSSGFSATEAIRAEVFHNYTMENPHEQYRSRIQQQDADDPDEAGSGDEALEGDDGGDDHEEDDESSF